MRKTIVAKTHRSPRSGSRGPSGLDSRVNSFPSVQGDETCDDCHEADPDTYFCNDWNSYLCTKCWPKQLAHRTQRLARGGPRHEKTNISLARKINNVLMPTSDPQKLTQLHEDDRKLLGSVFNAHRMDAPLPFWATGDSHISFRPQWANGALVFNMLNLAETTEHPALCHSLGKQDMGKVFCTPVVGAPGVTDPTSENVHLYLDPVTAVSEAPIVLADCEGLLGGEREPISAKLGQSTNKTANSTPLPIPISERELAWADSTSLRSRQYAVTNLYPRLLYTFSDVIVFVLKKPRAIEDVLEHFVEWAAAALEKASNQYVLPHVIIALNGSENSIDETLWDPKAVTLAVLDSISRTVNRNNTFKKICPILERAPPSN
ncbi:Nn.00g004550.m01.CDS01 [Neocucurbitaria sp. VM-36]